MLYIYESSVTFQFLGFFRSRVSKLFFSLRDSETKNYKSFMFKPIWGLCIDTTRIMIKPSC